MRFGWFSSPETENYTYILLSVYNLVCSLYCLLTSLRQLQRKPSNKQAQEDAELIREHLADLMEQKKQAREALKAKNAELQYERRYGSMKRVGSL